MVDQVINQLSKGENMSSRACGISISGGKAMFVILDGVRDDLKIIETTFKKIQLDDDTNQDLIKSFYTAVEDFFKQYQIESIFIKKSNTSGKFTAGSKSFKIEALIQLMPYKVELVASQTIASFEKKNKIPVDKFDKLFKYQVDAFKVGFYGIGL